MKKWLQTAALACITTLSANAQCSIFMPMEKGARHEMTMFNGKEKQIGTVSYTVADARDNGKEADMVNEVTNEKGKVTSTTNYTIRCNNGNIEIDIKSLVPAQTMEGYKDMDVKAKGDAYIAIPQELAEGQTLPDAKGAWEISAKGSTTVMTTLTMDITNRKVAAKETIATPAGTFDCFKITGNTKMVTSTFGLNVPFEFTTEEWYSPGTGLVKSASYRNDKLQGYNILSKK